MSEPISDLLAGKHKRRFDKMRLASGASARGLELAILEKFLSLFDECPDVLDGVPDPRSAKLGGGGG